jgi:hypothetical protein
MISYSSRPIAIQHRHRCLLERATSLTICTTVTRVLDVEVAIGVVRVLSNWCARTVDLCRMSVIKVQMNSMESNVDHRCVDNEDDDASARRSCLTQVNERILLFEASELCSRWQVQLVSHCDTLTY